MIDSYKNDINWAKSNKKRVEAVLDNLSKGRIKDLEINEKHNNVFAKIDCLMCGNCCRTTGPMLQPKDISRLSKRLKLSEKSFFDSYLRIDEDGDFVFKSMPCPFLGDDNFCSVYDDRPKACRAFPHTDQKGQADIANLTRKNVRICPAVSRIFQSLSKVKK